MWDRYLSSPEFGAPRVIVERSAVQDLAPLGISPGGGDVRVDVLEAGEEVRGSGESQGWPGRRVQSERSEKKYE